mmetsp:Transcript_25267/g.54999  ORF Transcript_25267/g.54999 Transcript_25267/m.54999 type:complete len:121 (+) Transcript_25267:369-731(+)
MSLICVSSKLDTLQQDSPLISSIKGAAAELSQTVQNLLMLLSSFGVLESALGSDCEWTLDLDVNFDLRDTSIGSGTAGCLRGGARSSWTGEVNMARPWGCGMCTRAVLGGSGRFSVTSLP